MIEASMRILRSDWDFVRMIPQTSRKSGIPCGRFVAGLAECHPIPPAGYVLDREGRFKRHDAFDEKGAKCIRGVSPWPKEYGCLGGSEIKSCNLSQEQ